MTEARVKDYYTGYVRQEWRRLIRDAYHGLEFHTTLHFLEEHLPQKGLILDAGGGPGRYTIEVVGMSEHIMIICKKSWDSLPATL
jgi:hypothetical protein